MFELSGSASVAVTFAVFVIWPAVFGVTTMVTIALAPFVSVPTPQVTVVVPLQEPCVVEVDPKVTLPGKVSVTLTFVAVAGPLFVTTIR